MACRGSCWLTHPRALYVVSIGDGKPRSPAKQAIRPGFGHLGRVRPCWFRGRGEIQSAVIRLMRSEQVYLLPMAPEGELVTQATARGTPASSDARCGTLRRVFARPSVANCGKPQAVVER